MVEYSIIGIIVLGAIAMLYKHIKRPSCGCGCSCSTEKSTCASAQKDISSCPGCQK